jgi:superfamily II DNA or RNA helicase
MNKAVLTSRIMLPVKDKAHEEAIIHTLTYKLQDEYMTRVKQREVAEVIRNYIRFPKGFFSIPIGRVELIPEEYTIEDNRVFAPVDFPKHNLVLRPSQQAVYDHITDSCIINAPVSWGKTYTGIAIASKFAQRTLVITHTTALRDQWISDIQKVLNITPGIIGGGDWSDLDKPIVVANIQTLRKDVDRISKLFGLVILDECHHVPATTFSDVIDKMWARYRIGLSGTIQRKDKKHVLFHDFFGRVIYQPEAENRVNPNVLIIKSKIRIPTGNHWAYSMTELGNNDEYRELVSNLANTMADKGHKVLVIGERVNFLESCARRSGDRACVITGSVKDFQERTDLMNGIRDSTYDILYGSRAIFSEGISLNELSCLILACPINNNLNLEQLIGRIQRIVEGKRTPLVIDLNLADNVSKNQATQRRAYYISKGYKIFTLDEK